MNKEFTPEIVSAQIEAVTGCADALERMIGEIPEDFVKGVKYAVVVLRASAKSFEIEYL